MTKLIVDGICSAIVIFGFVYWSLEHTSFFILSVLVAVLLFEALDRR